MAADRMHAEPDPPPRRWGAVRVAGLAALAAAGLLAAVTRLSVSGHWYGLYVLRDRDGLGLEVKDDLYLGDGPRLLAGVSLARGRALLGPPQDDAARARLELEWDAATGSGLVRNHLADGTELVTLFGRYEDSEGLVPHGLFLGGALPDVAADAGQQNESGMTYRDARGWSHVWCNVNEGVWLGGTDIAYPGRWRFLGSRVLMRDRDRVVLESSHEVAEGAVLLRVDRHAYFRAGAPFFKLGIRIVNAGETPARYTYLYGDEPWVGEFGSSAGNVGWLAGGLVAHEAAIDTREHAHAGIVDVDTGVADFVAWLGEDRPDVAFFSNAPGPPGPAGAPLASNEVFIGLEWRDRQLAPGESRSILLALGMADRAPDGRPVLPAAVSPAR